MSDVGPFRRKSGVSYRVIMEDSELCRNFKDAFTENFVLTELLSQGIRPYFWRSGNTAELDFLFEKFSLKNVRENLVGETTTISLPLYLIWLLKTYCKEAGEEKCFI